MEEQVNIKLLTLLQKKDKDLYAYYRWIEILFIGILEKDQVTQNRENAIILNNTK